MTLFDVQCALGPLGPGRREILTAQMLLTELDHAGIARALVRTTPTPLELDVLASNARLFAECATAPCLLPCPVLLPAGCGDLPTEHAQLAAVLEQGAGAVAVRPRLDDWSLAPWCCGPLFQALEARRVPVLCSHDEFTLEELAEVAGRYPALPLVLFGVHYRQQRVLLPLLMAFPNLFLSIGTNFCEHRGVEHYSARVGSERLLFGTGFPDVDPLAQVAYLRYADLPPAAHQQIGAGNLDRLLAEVVR
jgi:hypothetical protein